MTVTREAILEAVSFAYDMDDSDDYHRTIPGYDALTDLFGHDLADVINLGLVVLKQSEGAERPSHWCDKPYADGWNECLDFLFVKAGVDRPAT